MFAIDDPTAAAVLPPPAAAGTPGFWTEGNPATGVQATRVRADFLNMLQQELLNVVIAGGLTPSKTTYTQLRDSIKTLAAGHLVGIQIFTSSGTYTPTPGATLARVRMVGGGGAGGGAPATSASTVSAGLGGSGGAYSEFLITSGLTSTSVTVGAAGTPTSGGTGGNGGNTSFGAYSTAAGGVGGAAAGPTGTAYIANTQSNNAVPAVAGATKIFASPGQLPANSVVVLSTSMFYSGQGANSPYGVGGGGQGAGVGGTGLGYGSGGGGSASSFSTGARLGGTGAPGLVIVEEYA